MWISTIKTWPIRYEDGNDFGRAKSTPVVEVTSAGGVSGWGGAVTLAPEATFAVKAVIDHGFAPPLISAGDIAGEDTGAMMRGTLGSDFSLMTAAGHGGVWDCEAAIRTMSAMGEQGISWVEQPFCTTRIEDSRALQATVDMPVAAGEGEFTGSAYLRLTRTGTVDVLGLDPACPEGVAGFRKIDTLCTDCGTALNARGWSDGLLTAASLHPSPATPNTRVFELKPSAVSVQDELLDAPIKHLGGRDTVLNQPGPGVVIAPGVLESLAL